MQYPTLTSTDASRDMTDVFLGYNHNPRITLGEWYDMQNLTSDYYPILSPRKKRGVFQYPQGVTPNTQGIISKDHLCYVNEGTFYINGYGVPNFSLTSGEKTLISMGAKVIIFPDKKYINTIDYNDKGSLEASYTSSGTVTYTLCKIDTSDYDPNDIIVSATEPTDTTKLWMDTSTEIHSLKQFAQASGMWITIATTYIKISASGIAENFNEGDGVTISGVTPSQLADLNSTMIVQAKGNGFIIVIGILDQAATQTTPISITRRIPAMDFVVESGNRLWGCRYGENNNGEVVNEIYASKLGDPSNWQVYNGIASDSYTASCGTDGQWTGAIAYKGLPLFFKENTLHKVQGNIPANYSITDITCRGVQKGSHKSLAIVNETLFYKSRNGICAYDGTLPTEISDVFGGIQYSNAVGGANKDKYYISMKDVSNVYHLFVFDLAKNLWHKEDNLQVDAFCSDKGIMYYIDSQSKTIRYIESQGTDFEVNPIKWFCETGIIGTSEADHKYIQRLTVRLSVEGKVKFSIEYDSSGHWEEITTLYTMGLKSSAFNIRPRRCDHFRLRMDGEGVAKIFSITKVMEQGSDDL